MLAKLCFRYIEGVTSRLRIVDAEREAVWERAAKHSDIGGRRKEAAYLCNHHMAVKCALAIGASRAVNVWTDLGDDWGAKGHIWHKMAVHDVDLRRVRDIVSRNCSERRYMKPVGTLGNGVGARLAQCGEVGRQN